MAHPVAVTHARPQPQRPRHEEEGASFLLNLSAMYRQMYFLKIKDKKVRKRLLDEWIAISVVSTLFAALAVIPFCDPPPDVRTAGETIRGVYGFFCGLAVLTGTAGGVLVCVYQFFLNRVPPGGAGDFAWQFSAILPLPLLSLVFSMTSMLIAQLIIQRFFYTVTFIAALAVYCAAIAAGAAVFYYQYWHVEALGSLEVRRGVAAAEEEEERWKAGRRRAAAQERALRLGGPGLQA